MFSWITQLRPRSAPHASRPAGAALWILNFMDQGPRLTLVFNKAVLELFCSDLVTSLYIPRISNIFLTNSHNIVTN